MCCEFHFFSYNTSKEFHESSFLFLKKLLTLIKFKDFDTHIMINSQRSNFPFIVAPLLLLFLFFDSFALLPAQRIHVLMYDEIKNPFFFSHFSQASAQYFQISLLTPDKNTKNLAQKNSFTLTSIEQKHCSIIPYKLDDREIFFCSNQKSKTTPIFHQLLACLDSPLTRKFCAQDHKCRLPEVFKDSSLDQLAHQINMG